MVQGEAFALVLNYAHLGGTNPTLVELTGQQWPVSTGSAMGVDGTTLVGGTPGAFGHVANAVFSGICARKMRFRGETTSSTPAKSANVVVDFTTTQSTFIDYVTSKSTFATWSSSGVRPISYTYLPGNTGIYPDGCNFTVDDSGATSTPMAGFPVYCNNNGNRHFSMRAQGCRWEVDNYRPCDGGVAGYALDTWHQVWIR